MNLLSTFRYQSIAHWSIAVRALVGLALGAPVVAHSQAVATPSDYTRTSSFTYYLPADGAKNGLLATETVEPGSGAAVVTTYTYDGYGNKISAVTQNAGTPTGNSKFDTRKGTSTYPTSSYVQAFTVNGAASSASIAPGLFATTQTTDATLSGSQTLSLSEGRTYDPRFGASLSLTGPNQLTTSWTFDDFGRKTSETRADGTSTVIYYCLLGLVGSTSIDQSSNSVGCASVNTDRSEFPASGVMFVHSEDRDKSNTKMGPATRVYSDSFGRTVRTVTESFDGASQSNKSLIMRDVTYNAAGLKVRETAPYFLTSGPGGITQYVYDVLGRPTTVATSDPTGNGILPLSPGKAASQSIAYNGLSTTTTNDKGQTRTEQKNANGEVILVTDALGAQIAYQRDAFGNLIKTVDALGNTITLTYDVRGRKLSMTDPDTGTWSYDYDALGQLVWQQSANQKASGQPATIMAYDLLGRMTQRVDPEYISTWTYDSCTTGAGKLCQSTTSNGLTRQIAYDTTGRVSVNRTTVTNGPAFGGAFSYDPTTGRLATQTYPTGLQVGYVYTARGFLSQLQLKTAATITPLPATPGGAPGAGASLAANSVLWQAQSVNARGQIEQQSYGNGVVGKAAFDATTGRLSTLTAGVGTATNVQSDVYTWDSIGNLTVRSDANGDGSTGTTENFTYGDKLNRLTQYQVLASSNSSLNRTVSLQYNALGMLLSKDDVGGYTYPGATAAHPHALQKLLSATATTSSTYTYDANGNMLTSTAGGYRSIAYNSFNLPDSQSGITGAPGGSAYSWQYDENHARIKETRVSSQGTRTTWELHPDNMGGLGFESETEAGAPYAGAVSQRHYLTAGGQVIGVLVSTGPLAQLAAWPSAPTASTSMTLVKVEYWHKDHLGSLAATTDHAGNLTARYAYDPFGKRRNTNGTYDPQGTLIGDYSPATNNGTDRGFTGHEHLDDVGIVHMNGRLFDPKLGIFMQSDPFVGNPENLQNYNRYGYCYNNPLNCTDPSGQIFGIDDIFFAYAIAALWGAEKVGIIDARTARSFTGIAVSLVLAPTGVGAWTLTGAAQAATAGFAGSAISSGSFKGGLQGAFSAVAFYGVGSAIASNGGSGVNAAGEIKDGAKFAGAIAAHAVVGCVTSMTSGGKCGSGALAAGFSKAALPWTVGVGDEAGTAISAVVGGTASALGGGKFANGAVTGAYSYIFNQLATASRAAATGAVAAGSAIAPSLSERLALVIDQTAARVGDVVDYIFKSDSVVLARNMIQDTDQSREPGQHAHHIVAANDPRADPARTILGAVGMDINSAYNGVFLDSSEHLPIHTNVYYGAVNAGLTGATTYTDVALRLTAMRALIQTGTFPH